MIGSSSSVERGLRDGCRLKHSRRGKDAGGSQQSFDDAEKIATRGG
ncbi:hypothetical protein NSQ90_08770 [Paenibacillus sp. FSL H7-0737]|nr:hypothetical protein [Paenibacillus sp. FSL H7-0737]